MAVKLILLVFTGLLFAQYTSRGIQRIRTSDYYTIEKIEDETNTCYVAASRFNTAGVSISCIKR